LENDRFTLMKLRQVIATGLVGAILFNQTLLASRRDGDFWAERRRERQRRVHSSDVGLLARVPVSGGGEPLPFTATIPVAEKIPFSSVSPGAAVRSLSPRVSESYKEILSALPQTHVSIRKLTLPPNGAPRGVVYFIQDVHKNREAQNNIARTISNLIHSPSSSSPVALLGLEGAFAPYDLSYLRSFPDPVAAQVAAEELLFRHEISGPIYSVLTTTSPIPSVVGVDDPDHYNANVEAYRRSLPHREEQKAWALSQRTELEILKASQFNGDLLEYDRHVQAYQRGELSLSHYIKTYAEDKRAPLGGSLKRFLEALRLEESLDFKKVETERGLLLESLAKTLDHARVEALVAHSVVYRSGELSYGDFYRWLQTLCDEAGIRLSNFPAMEGYVLTAEGIDAESLFQEMNRREQDLRVDHGGAYFGSIRELTRYDRAQAFGL
jgi:hypothetical protein